MQLNSLERRMSNIRLVPKVVLLMVFSTLLLLAKLWFDASNLEATLLGEGIDATKANAIADRLLWTGLMETALMGVVFVVLLLTRVSGIPLLEAKAQRKWGDDPEYQAYRARTPALIPGLRGK